jgi:hypothetical protein
LSIKVMTAVWSTSAQSGNALLILLAIADFADDAGVAWPSITTIARKARVAERTAQRIIRHLEKQGELTVEDGAGSRAGTHRFTVTPAAGQQLELAATRGDTRDRGDKLAPLPNGARRGDTSVTGGVTQASPEPPGNRQSDPSGTAQIESALRPPTEREIATALKASVAWAEAEWLRRRSTAGIDRFLEPWGRPLKDRVGRAYQDGCTDADIVDAINSLAVDPKGSPWYIDDRARAAQTRRENAARERERGVEAVQRARDADAAAEADWLRREKETGKTRAELIRELIPKPTAKPGDGPLAASTRAIVSRVTEQASTPARPAKEAT